MPNTTPNYLEYHKQLTRELDALKDRIRNLVTHWQTDGEWKESALRAVLRRHLPNDTFVGRGFVVGPDFSSTQLDLLVLKQGRPTLFRDGDLAIVTPEAPGAIVEVKTRLSGTEDWLDAVRAPANIGRLCRLALEGISRVGDQNQRAAPWLGVFCYEHDADQGENILDAVEEVWRKTCIPINCVCCGKDTFVRYWPKGEFEPGDDPSDGDREYWRLYYLEDLAPSYFVGNLVDSICSVDNQQSDFAWFAYRDGKRARMISERRIEGRCFNRQFPPRKERGQGEHTDSNE